MRYVLSLSLILLFSCTSMKKQSKSDTASGNQLAGTEWTLSRIPEFEMENTRKVVSISFSDSSDRVSGNAGCNNFGGHYTASGSTLKLDKIIATKMACMPGLDTENKVMSALNSADHFSISGDKLTLMKGTKVLAEYSRGKKEQK